MDDSLLLNHNTYFSSDDDELDPWDAHNGPMDDDDEQDADELDLPYTDDDY